MTSNPTFKRTDQTMFSEIDRDVVALQIDQGFCYGMENVTAEVWRLFDEPQSLETICSKLMTIYDVSADTCRSDVAQLLDKMHQEGLIEQV